MLVPRTMAAITVILLAALFFDFLPQTKGQLTAPTVHGGAQSGTVSKSAYFAEPAMVLQDPATKQKKPDPSFLPDDVVAMEYSPDSKHLVSASRDGWLRYWELKTGKIVWKLNFQKTV